MNEDFLTLDQFLAAGTRVESVFHVERRLPEQVFKRLYRLFSSTRSATGWMPRPHRMNLQACPILNESARKFPARLDANYGSRADLEKKLGQKVEYPWEKKETAPRA
jgi:hypothetical protein